jgi:hypothetical protein
MSSVFMFRIFSFVSFFFSPYFGFWEFSVFKRKRDTRLHYVQYSLVERPLETAYLVSKV